MLGLVNAVRACGLAALPAYERETLAGLGARQAQALREYETAFEAFRARERAADEQRMQLFGRVFGVLFVLVTRARAQACGIARLCARPRAARRAVTRDA